MNVLIIDDNPDHRELLRRRLQKEFPDVRTTDITRPAELDAALARADFDFVFTDYRLNWTDGLTILKTLRERMPEVPVVMVTDTGSEEIAAQGMKSGLSDYILKGHLHRIPLVIRESLEKARLRKERENALRSLEISEERYRAVSELCSDYAYSYQVSADRRFRREWTTHAFSRITGHEIEALDQPEGWLAFLHPDDRRIFEERDRQLLAGYPHVCEFRIFSKDGSMHWIRDYARPVWDEKENRVVRVFGASRDITERQQAREEHDRLIREQAERKEAEASEHRYRSLAEAIPQMVWSSRPDGWIDYFNRRWYDYTGKSFDETQGWGWQSVVHPEDEKSCLHTWREAVRTGQTFEIECRFRRFDGAYRWHLSRAVPARDADKSIVKWFGTCTDVDDQKKSEEALRQSAKLESIGLLAGGVAHDFNNLLTGIMGNASLAIDLLADPDPARPLIQDVLQASERAADLTRQLLAYSGKGRFVVKAVNVSELTAEIAHLIHASIPKTVNLQMQLQPDLPLVHADPSQIQQLIMNLVINGAEAIGDEKAGTVLVSTGVKEVRDEEQARPFHGFEIAPGNYVSLEVRDTGSGMDEHVQSRIFDPFFTTKFMGRGLGLAAAQGIVRGHKGAIRVSSEPGKGSRFEVLLPVANVPALKPKPITAGGGHLEGIGTVLVVDDEEVVRRAARAALERYGYNVLLAESGAKAIEILGKAPDKVDIVIMDMTMPIMGGEEALRRLRLIRPNLRAIASSGYNQVIAMQRFASQRLSEFVQKPYTAEQLAEKVKVVLLSQTVG